MPTTHPSRTIGRLVVAAAASLMFDAAAAVAQQAEKKAWLWKDPGSIAARDLLWASGSSERAPRGPFVFLEEEHAEIASNRLVWALGYIAEEVPYGTFNKARFSLRNETSARAEERWTFEQNPFVNTQELSGLAILMTMVNNWDIQGPRNNRILNIDGEQHYIVSDLGATFGKMGARLAPHSKWNLEDFAKEEFIEKVEDGKIDLDYEGHGGINKVPVEHARWFLGLVSQLTDDQLRAAFHASGASDAETAGFSARLREKITELQKTVGTTNVGVPPR